MECGCGDNAKCLWSRQPLHAATARIALRPADNWGPEVAGLGLGRLVGTRHLACETAKGAHRPVSEVPEVEDVLAEHPRRTTRRLAAPRPLADARLEHSLENVHWQASMAVRVDQ